MDEGLFSIPTRKVIDDFHGEYRFLSNFYDAPLDWEGVYYPSSEHAYQAAKVLDDETRKAIAALTSPGKAKAYGRQVRKRSDWDAVRLEVMREILRIKFAPGTALATRLLATGDADLIERNLWSDVFWGVYEGKGTNHLGRILMDIRAELRRAPVKLR